MAVPERDYIDPSKLTLDGNENAMDDMNIAQSVFKARSSVQIQEWELGSSDDEEDEEDDDDAGADDSDMYSNSTFE